MLNISFEEFKKNHRRKQNQVIYYSINTIGINEIKNLIDNFLIEKNSFVFESVEKGIIKGRYTIFGKNPDKIWEFNNNNSFLQTAEKKIKEYDKVILESKNKSKSYFNQAREKILKDISKKKEILDFELNEEIKKAETEINNFRKSAPEKINKIAIETSHDLIKQLIGVEVNNSSITTIVEDLSKKDRDKYYGN